MRSSPFPSWHCIGKVRMEGNGKVAYKSVAAVRCSSGMWIIVLSWRSVVVSLSPPPPPRTVWEGNLWASLSVGLVMCENTRFVPVLSRLWVWQTPFNYCALRKVSFAVNDAEMATMKKKKVERRTKRDSRKWKSLSKHLRRRATTTAGSVFLTHYSFCSIYWPLCVSFVCYCVVL